MIRKKPKNYINNKDLSAALITYAEQCKIAETEGKEKPQVPNYIAESFFMIANRLGRKGNFSSYPFLEDMKMDGVENCLRYMHNFNPEKTNPFAYFTQIIWNAYLRRIAKEKKQMYIRYKSSQEMISMGETYDSSEDIKVHLNTNVDYINSFIEDFESKLSKNNKE